MFTNFICTIVWCFYHIVNENLNIMRQPLRIYATLVQKNCLNWAIHSGSTEKESNFFLSCFIKHLFCCKKNFFVLTF